MKSRFLWHWLPQEKSACVYACSFISYAHVDRWERRYPKHWRLRRLYRDIWDASVSFSAQFLRTVAVLQSFITIVRTHHPCPHSSPRHPRTIESSRKSAALIRALVLDFISPIFSEDSHSGPHLYKHYSTKISLMDMKVLAVLLTHTIIF